MNYFRRILLTEQLNDYTLKQLLNKPLGRFYLGYLSIVLSENKNKLVQDNIDFIKQYI